MQSRQNVCEAATENIPANHRGLARWKKNDRDKNETQMKMGKGNALVPRRLIFLQR